MRKKLLMKSLLVAAALCVGVLSVSAREVVETYDLQTWGNSHMNRNTYATMGTTSAGFQVNSVDMYELTITGSKDSETWDLSSRFAVSNNVTYRWGSGGSDVPRLGNENQSGARYISIIDLKADDRVVITCSNVLFFSTNATYDVEGKSTAVTAGGAVTSGTTYTITGEGTQRLDLSINSRTWGNITKVIITREVPEGTVESPVSSITGANNNARIFTLTCATEGATIYYSTTEKTTDAEGWIEYTAPVETEAAYIWAYANKDGMTASEVIRFATGAGTTLELKGATFAKAYYDSSEGSYFVKVSDNQSAITGAPTTNLVYYTSNPESTTSFTSGDVLSGFAPGTTLYVKVAASGYASTTTSYYFPILTDYSVVWSDDFTSGEEITVTDAIKMGNQNCQPITKIGETSLTGNVGVDNFNTTRFNSTTDGLWVKSSRYMGAINVFSQGLIKVTVNKEGYENDLITVRKDLSTYNVVRSADGKTYDIYYTPGASSVTWNIFNGLYIKSVSFLAPSANVEISSAGWATLYTTVPLDFSGVTGLTAYTAALEGSTVTLTAVDNVPANTGVVLKGDAKTYSIPAIASSTTDKGDLLGSTTDVNVDADAENVYYVLAKSGDADARFAKVSSGSIAAGKAYLKVAKAAAREFFAISGDDVTAIESVKAQQMNGEVYNLNGQRVAAPQKGLYIVNGKKVVLK